MTIGIRREDKNKWEKRVPLVPKDLKFLKEKYGINTIIQPSDIRSYRADDFRNSGVTVNEDLSNAGVVFAIKEIPKELFLKGKTYVFFSHTLKGQSYNMSMLKRLMDLECNLIDYEKIVNSKGQRLVFFGNYAGYAGMIDTLNLLGEKLKLQGLDTPLTKIKRPLDYASLQEAKESIKLVGEEINEKGLPHKLAPVIFGFAGYGNVSRGAQEILDILPHKVISPEILPTIHNSLTLDNRNIYKVVFREEHLFRRNEGNFELSDYYNNPGNYDSRFETYIPYLTVLMNCIFWTEKYPRIVTKKYLRDAELRENQKLRFIGDISCDIDGAIEITHKITTPDHPVFTYDPVTETYNDGILGEGITLMSIDNLPCELPNESSAAFSSLLLSYVPEISKTDFSKSYEELELSQDIKNGLILHKGKFTEPFHYMQKFLKG